LSRLELAQRYARERLLEDRSAMNLAAAASTSPPGGPAAQTADNSGRFQQRSRRADRGSRALAHSIIQRYDSNRNNILEPPEVASAGIDLGKVDFDRDGLVDTNELAEYLFLEMESQGNDLSELLPTWFFERDLNGDQQVEMSEFA